MLETGSKRGFYLFILPLSFQEVSEAAGLGYPTSTCANRPKQMGTCNVLLEKVVWDQRIMAIVVRIVDEGWECANDVAHITVGTRANDVKPKESNDLLKKWLELGSGDASGIGEVAIDGQIVLEGAVKGVLSR